MNNSEARNKVIKMKSIDTVKTKEGDTLRIKCDHHNNMAVISIKLISEPEEGFQFVCGGGVKDMMKVFNANKHS